ncbi:MAG: tRNA (adenosine(37)-N6)-threonylcarbamoyltransferase complex ATPase subunit type 1 TsaE [Synergistaceae bacterium]|nr:tRNA (adenosine(37)-N6)-threonylcarbamoyltransferase complex ATPase subunit type 1 TsaE [Synergistaceae bacterium]
MTRDRSRRADVRVKFPSVESRSEGETEIIARFLAAQVYGGLTVILSGALGAGKTALVRGIAEALGASGVKSPTFAIESRHRLPEKEFELVHADLYRLGSVPACSDEALQMEELVSGKGASLLLVEWGERWENPPLTDRWDVAVSMPEDVRDGGTSVRVLDFAAWGMKALEKLSAAYSALLGDAGAGRCR